MMPNDLDVHKNAHFEELPTVPHLFALMIDCQFATLVNLFCARVNSILIVRGR